MRFLRFFAKLSELQKETEKAGAMRYYKQFHRRPYAYLLALVFACLCLCLMVLLKEVAAQTGMLVCAVFALIATRILRKAREHYLNIDEERIVHHGFTDWTVPMKDVVNVTHGKKGLLEDHDLYFKIHTAGQEYAVDDGFLINEKRVKELLEILHWHTEDRRR